MDPRRQHHLWTDEELIRSVAQLDDLAFQALYLRYADAAYGVASHIARPPLRAEDVIQEAFLAVWRSGRHFDPGKGPVRPWLLGIVRNRAIDALRRARTRREAPGDPETVLERIAGGALPEGQALRSEDARTIRRALEQLPAHQAAVVDLAYFGGLSHAEIAARLGAPLGTVKGRMRLALLKLRDTLDDFAEAER